MTVDLLTPLAVDAFVGRRRVLAQLEKHELFLEIWSQCAAPREVQVGADLEAWQNPDMLSSCGI